jgi:hypothetical protein
MVVGVPAYIRTENLWNTRIQGYFWTRLLGCVLMKLYYSHKLQPVGANLTDVRECVITSAT